jgi:pimeloyl-ACP methyl ester carboxylesterase
MAVIGLSGGGPYTLGCAAAMPDRVVAVGVLGGVAPTVGADAIGGEVMRSVQWWRRCSLLPDFRSGGRRSG